ncbi:MAG: hypothetical protein IJR31_06175 [Lachnospiraceae bacterium]|nr:hypothetical protein [Lachnospiraceae bacterium]
MSMYSGIIQKQAETIERLEKLTGSYHQLTQELTDVLSQHIDVSEYERRLAELSRKEEKNGQSDNADAT